MPIIPRISVLKQDDHKLEASLGYTARLSKKNNNNMKSMSEKSNFYVNLPTRMLTEG